MQHQQELSADEGVYGPQWMLLVLLVPFDAEAVVVAEVHGEDVVCHVGHTVPDDKVSGQPVPVINNVAPARWHNDDSCRGRHDSMDGGHQPLADQHHVGIAPVFEHTRQESPEGEEQTGENYGATS